MGSNPTPSAISAPIFLYDPILPPIIAHHQQARGPKHFKAILHAMGMPFTHLRSLATIAVELVGGLLVLGAASEPLAEVPMIAVAIVTVHLPSGFSSIKLMAHDAAGAHFGQRDMKPNCFISRASARCA